MERLSAQIEITVLQADVFGIVRLRENRQRQFFGSAFDNERFSRQLNLTGWQLRIHCFCIASDELTCHGQDTFRRGALCFFVERCVRIDDDLRQAIMITQVDKQGPSVLPAAMQPA